MSRPSTDLRQAAHRSLAIEQELYHLPGFYDPFSAMSHLLGLAVFVVLAANLLRRTRGDRAAAISSMIYACSVLVMLSMSSVFHMLGEGTARSVFLRLDYAAIFLLIAGTITPIHTMLFTGWCRWAPLSVAWTCAITGVTLKTIFLDAVPDWLGLALYLALGWFGVVSAFLIHRAYGISLLKPLIAGATAYTLGALVMLFKWPTPIPRVAGPHEVFHLAVMAGLSFHWILIMQVARLRAQDHAPRGAAIAA